MKLVATMMVRDEVDIVAATIEHHLDQGVDLIIVTDNASVDGTTEVLQRYADAGHVELHHDPEHRKQHGEVVTTMARRAATEHGADWVLNIDADEFTVAADRDLTVREALEQLPKALASFSAPVTNLVGPPARRGGGVGRLLWRDERTEEQIREVGIHAQPSPNAIHIGAPKITVRQGNHFVSRKSRGCPMPAYALEVLHLPWRSWEQFERKVMHAGRGYDASPTLRPSRNHHGMADYRRAKQGRLVQSFLLRMPQVADLEAGDGFTRDDWLATYLTDLVSRAVAPDLLEAVLAADDDEPWSPEEHAREAETGAKFLLLERELRAEQDEVLRLQELLDALEAPEPEAVEDGAGRVRAALSRVRGRVARGVRRRDTAR
ncbi:hypothetical protein GCM10011519_15600 [Marmoricola endophyticus]|uniref:Glycosyl transferase family 2 n=1 Tax=Marmoricola endophyticus TaxID=2040280 RepID=A0A917F4P5_9ACTN|nr:glycosyltransferase family 2 protein [Marmoricola endophyticus]GGF42611.1 hypothetical protein GCM10011519_15600 [Marmoricola endophyticus]